MNRTHYLLKNLKIKLSELQKGTMIGSPKLVTEIEDYIEHLLPRLQSKDASWQEFSTFWPPRCVDALRQNKAMIFFGAGASISSGIPSWKQLLSIHFGLDKAFTDDDDLANDPLTLGELASQHLGSEVLQNILRGVMNQPRQFSVGHAVLAALRCPVYVTTNYDCLFEQAWEQINPGPAPLVVTSDGGLLTNQYQEAFVKGKGTVLFKIHGSSDRKDEYLILTRKDYRSHYRTNTELFKQIRELLRERHTIFLGFSHRDPEVSRLVEDAIYDYENPTNPSPYSSLGPQFYSLQFGMGYHTAEIFAARGIVALQPPTVNTSIEYVRDKQLAIALVDLLATYEFNLHSKVGLDKALTDTIKEISAEIDRGLDTLQKYEGKALSHLLSSSSSSTPSWLTSLQKDLGPLASQGIYLLDDQGNTVIYSVPPGLSAPDRIPTESLSTRPYFQQAKSFRKPFLSDTTESIFNRNSTFFLCQPILDNGQSIGLLFSAAQVGEHQWNTPITIASDLWKKNMSLSVIDTNGVCLIPPRNEFQTAFPKQLIKGETKNANRGYHYERLVELSRRDVLIAHLSRSVVPVTQDDDVLELASDLKEFSVVAEIPQTRWKVAVSIPIPLKTRA